MCKANTYNNLQNIKNTILFIYIYFFFKLDLFFFFVYIVGRIIKFGIIYYVPTTLSIPKVFILI
jgi:hypothetical protein